MSSFNGHHAAAGGPCPGGQSSFLPGAYSNISSLSPPSQHMGSTNSKSAPPPPSSGPFKAAVKRAFASKKKKHDERSAEHHHSSSSLLNKKSGLHHPSSPPTPPKHDTHIPLNTEQSRAIQPLNRASIIPISPGISPAVNYMLQQQRTPPAAPATKSLPHVSAPDKFKLAAATDNMLDKKETWRKSDSTNSHHTVRPGGGPSSSGTSRPVSWAESFQSAHTVVQASNKRLSALITDGMPEEDDDESFVSVSDGHPSKSTPPSSVKVLNRRSVSLNLGTPSTINKTPVPPMLGPSVTEPKHSSHSISKGISPSAPSQHASASPTYTQQSQSPTASNIRGRFAAWTTNSSSDNVSRQERTLPAIPSQRQHAISQYAPGGGGTSSTPTSLRQTAISMTASGLGPAAAGLAKRAVEKMGRKWGMGPSPSTSGGSASGYSSSSSSMNGPPSFSSASHTDYGLVRTSSNLSTPSVHSHIVKSSHSHGSAVGFVGGVGGGKRRTPDAPSGAYSVHSVASTSDNDPFSSSGPILGRMLRGGLRSQNGVPVTGGVVFGRELRMVTRETGVNVGKGVGSAGVDGGKRKEGLVLDLEERLVPAIVVRCAQHLLIWGVQEEGLFRVNGRPFHVSKLRSEFDSGVDYDMTECSPGDLDPHAVASVFKAYLRELPESILTHALSPFFDAAIKKEASNNFSEENRFSRVGRENNPRLPQGPKSGFAVRKPPSLTTLAMPTFSGIPPPSTSLVADIRSLISQLPQENYDLLHTVVDLIKATGKESKKTKMPLSNLLLVFCPSLNMTPPLLKVFCEAEDIWAGGSEREVEMKDSPPPPPLPTKDVIAKEEEAEMTDTSEDEGEEKSLTSSGRTSLDTTDDPSSGYHASEEEEASLFEGHVVRRRWASERNTERSEIPTVYLDTMSHYSFSSTSSLREPLEPSDDSRPHHQHHHPTHSRDGIVIADDDGSISSPSRLVHLVPPTSSPFPPLCSSSVESVATPASEPNSSFSQLPVWDEGGEKIHAVGPVKIVDLDSIPMLPPAATATPTNKANTRPTHETAVQFPQLPNTSPARQAKRISIPLLSLPNFSPMSLATSGDTNCPRDDDSPCPSPTSTSGLTKRSKRPSLRLLFSKNKKSGSSLNSVGERSGNGIPFISNPVPQHHLQGPNSSTWELGTSDSSGSTPLSAVTASSGMSSRSHLPPPVLDTPIEDPLFGFDLVFDVSPPETATPGMRDQQKKLAKVGVDLANPLTATTTKTIPVKAEGRNLEEAPVQTPIAGRSPIVSAPSPLSPVTKIPIPKYPAEPLLHSSNSAPPLSLETQLLSSGFSISPVPSPQLSLLDDGEEDEEDWTHSVLSAANGLS